MINYFYFLSYEIIFKILSLLPVLSLLRCKLVCKSWLSIITNPHFIQTHLNISNTDQPSPLDIALVLSSKAVTNNREDVKRSLVCIHYREYSSSILLPPQFCAEMTQFIGYCNGLVCLGDYENQGICVWNPSIKRFKMLPTPNKITNCGPIKLGGGYDSGPIKLGVGYDSVSDDYKFVRILLSGVSRVVEAELYSVNADCWKEIELPKVVQNIWPVMTLIHVRAIDAVLYLVGVDVLVSFDLHNEVFEVYTYPEFVNSKNNSPSLVIFEGFVAMIFKAAVCDGSVYSLWTLDNVCGKVGWTKKFNLDPNLEMDGVDLYLGDGQFVAEENHDGFFLYDHIKKETRRIVFPVNGRKILSAVKYIDSLVSIQGFEPV